jgi:hypothetical protein
MRRELPWKRHGRRIFIVAFAMLLAGMASAPARAADALYEALLKAGPQSLPAGFSLAQIGPGPIDEEDQNAGMLGNAQITLQGADPTARINYLLFPDMTAANAYLAAFQNAILQRKATPRPLADWPEAVCAETPNGAACAVGSGRVAVFTLGTKVDGSVGPLLESALDHLNGVRKANGLR